MLASQTADELSQSYERNSLFSGKLRSGEPRDGDRAMLDAAPDAFPGSRLAPAPASGGLDLSKIFGTEAFLIGALGILFVAVFLVLIGTGDGVRNAMRDRSALTPSRHAATPYPKRP